MTKTTTTAAAERRRRDDDFAGIVAGLGHAVAIQEGVADPATYRVHVPAEVDVKAIRHREGLSQAAFAEKYGFTSDAVKQWEQKRRKPVATARVLLTIIAREPEAVQRALAGA